MPLGRYGMLYAKVVLGLPVEGPFDYIVPTNLNEKIKVGLRVWVPFRTKRMLGYVVGLVKKTKIKNLKAILQIIDESPILDENMLSFTKALSDYYCCTFGEAIETALPEGLRKGAPLQKISDTSSSANLSTPIIENNNDIVLLHDLDGQARWDVYIREIKSAISNNKSVIILFPDIYALIKAKEIIRSKLECPLGILYRKKPKELEEWIRIKEGKLNIIIATRSGIFAPVKNLGLVIIDEEQDSSYKQDQVPHYNARDIAFMRISIEKAKLILGSTQPTLESFSLAKTNKIQYIFIPRKRNYPEVKIIDMRKLPYVNKRAKVIFSKYLEDAIFSCLNSKGKILLFLNRKGFATFSSCRYCGIVMKCPRCDINLVYHFKDSILHCHYCNFKMPLPKICPNCNSGYIKYSGIGTEKIESELSRLFPQARIKRFDKQGDTDISDADICIATKSIIKKTNFSFDLIGVLSIDNSLNRIDFRAGEKTMGLLLGLLGLTEKKIVIQTNLPHYHCFQAIVNKDINNFYDEELKQRRQLNLPPFKHLGLVKLRSEREDRVKEVSSVLFKRLTIYKNKGINILSVNPGEPSKLRGKFYWQILTRSDSAKKLGKFLKIHLKDFSHSGIIVTVDIDPV